MRPGRIRLPISEFDQHFKTIAEQFQIHYHLALTDYRPKIAILVSAYDHCLADLLYGQRIGELPCEIVRIISNHPTAKPLADFYRVPFHLLTNPKEQTVVFAQDSELR
jgi:formyltetrahydrofolate deformylase